MSAMFDEGEYMEISGDNLWASEHCQTSLTCLVRHYKLGTFRAIGVSNYTAGHLAELLAECGTAPHVLQTELHPHYPQPGLTRLCDRHNIHVQAYSSLGAAGAESPLFQCPEVTRVADSLCRSRAQVQHTSRLPQSGH